MKVHFSSERPDWETPPDLFNKYKQEFDLDTDVCALPHNTKLPNYFSPETDGLKQDWTGLKCWMNPPYGREISKWIEKAANSKAKIVVALLPARTDTKWFHNHIYDNAEIIFLKGRIKFVGAKNSAPFPSMIVIWRN